MADSTSYPQLPSTVWSGVWRILHDSPSRKIDENVLSIELGVQKTAARQYLKELQRLGLFNDDLSQTDLAKKWRQDGDDPDIISEILEKAYPRELIDLAPPQRLDREKISRWFVTQGLGAGAAQNKAATYMRVANGVSAIEQRQTANGAKAKRGSGLRPSRSQSVSREAQSSSLPVAVEDENSQVNENEEKSGRKSQRVGFPELAVNVQIHISADSSAEQIDAIFNSMRKYFDDRDSD